MLSATLFRPRGRPELERMRPATRALGALTAIACLAGALSTVAGERDRTASRVAGEVDALLERDWNAIGRKHAAPAADLEFLRRTTIDLVGRIPTLVEARQFLADESPDRREARITALLESSAHQLHAARLWRRLWMPRSETPDFRRRAQAFDQWLSGEMTRHARYDDLVRRLMTASATPGPGLHDASVVPPLFLATSDFEPEQLAANSMRAFLGLNLDCAQCHDHPFSRWKQDQFWEAASFFARPPAAEGGSVSYRLSIPGKDRTVAPRFLTGESPEWPLEVDHQTGRKLLAEWLTSPGNDFFAKNAVNRYWAACFGEGLVEPLDDLSQTQHLHHPQVLSVLADAFVAQGFDLRFLTEVVVRTRFYQSTSETHGDGAVPMPVRVLSGESLYESLQVAAGLPADRFDLEDSAERWNRREAFVALFPNVELAGSERSRKQALALMNGAVTEAVTLPADSPLIAGLRAPFLDDSTRVDTLFLSTLCRFATDAEKSACLSLLGVSSDATAQIFWSLLNSSEFNTNH